MPLSLRRGTVAAVTERHDELVRLEVDGRPCVAYPRLTGPVEPGDDVVVNTQALDLGLGSGGFDVLVANLTRGLGLEAAAGAHVMVLPYTPLQAAVRHGEEEGPLAEALDGLPVVCCSLHSQVAPACAALAGLRVVYVQVAGGALPVSLSDTVRALRSRGLVERAVAAAPCVDGDVQCVNAASALLWAAGRGAEAVVCAVGPGIAGTGTALGHGAVAVAEAALLTGALGGRPVLAARVSERDGRDRHRGVSHHTAALRRLAPQAVLAWPDGRGAPAEFDPVATADASGWRAACAGLPLAHMGRGPGDDPAFFEAAFAAGLVARQLAGPWTT